jgi:hypothetical protein
MLVRITGLLKRHADAIQTAASIVSAVAIIFGAFQVLWGRQALDAQATAAALQSSRAILSQIEQNPSTFAKLARVDEAVVTQTVFINNIISLFSEQFYFAQAGVLPDDQWERFRLDLCDFVMLGDVQPQVVSNIERGSYLVDFKHELIRCGVKE